ncbi:3'(2'),5'-bisphosphate nucleotidase CysQ [Seonamhaeicola maritimus]|uniref:3'(2'),5'-bisphosphate nucleotidase CysQ n=1 Tax=Seonamhaeicola maritimus TaxID=2591822 RepID=UPI002494EA7D|nr:3'(2'),5'-bisphosphate nucleotidase CysQ [Seonamhaeicola maritimus]
MIEDNLFTAIKAALEVGEEILKIYNRDFTVDYKTDESPLTEADIASNDIINSYLSKTEIPIISEENRQLDYSERKEWNTCWIVDPLDGTKEFIKRNDEFTVNIALVEEGVTKFGVIYAPALKNLYYTDSRKATAYKLQIDSTINLQEKLFREQDKMCLSGKTKDVLRVIGSRSHMNNQTIQFVNKIKSKYKDVEIISKGSSLKFCILAEGLADIYPRFGPTMEWDTAAGQAICEAVGLRVIDISTKSQMVYNRRNLLNNYFYVATKDWKFN